MATILVVEDEQDMLEVIAYNLERAGHTVLRAGHGRAALEQLDQQIPNLIVSDIMMPQMDGLELCAEVRSRPETALTPFLFVTAKGGAEDKYAGLRAGADDYIVKPFELDDLIARVNGRLEQNERLRKLHEQIQQNQTGVEQTAEPGLLRDARRERSRLVSEVREQGAIGYLPPVPAAGGLRAKLQRFEERWPRLGEIRRTSLVGESPAFLEVFEEIVIAAASNDPVLILGETGTGKTAVAEAIHACGQRAEQSMRTVSCAELSAGDPTIAGAKLFGYGENSGLQNLPRSGQPGLLAESDGGALFLDEVALLPAQARALLLLPLEGRPFNPAVGTGGERRVDVKFIFATNRDLATEVEEGRFPRDLFERLAGEEVRLPSLRERGDDILRLAEHFLAAAAKEAGGGTCPELTRESRALLSNYGWPGNVRELRRTVRQAFRRADVAGSGVLEPAHFPESLVAPPSARASTPLSTGNPAPSDAPFSQRERGELDALRATGFVIGAAEAALGYSSRSRTLSHRLRGLGLKALSSCEWEVDRAAALLAGADPGLVATVARRLRSQLDGLAAKLDEPNTKVLSHLLAEHRPYALEALAMLRERSG